MSYWLRMCECLNILPILPQFFNVSSAEWQALHSKHSPKDEPLFLQSWRCACCQEVQFLSHMTTELCLISLVAFWKSPITITTIFYEKIPPNPPPQKKLRGEIKTLRTWPPPPIIIDWLEPLFPSLHWNYAYQWAEFVTECATERSTWYDFVTSSCSSTVTEFVDVDRLISNFFLLIVCLAIK